MISNDFHSIFVIFEGGDGNKIDFSNGPKAAYQSLINLEFLRNDEHQCLLVEKLHELFQRIKGYQPYKPGIFNTVCLFEFFLMLLPFLITYYET